jgi:hypothetical protein
MALALVDRVAGVIEELRTNHRDVRQPCRSSDRSQVDSYPTSEAPFDSSGHVIAQLLRPLQRSLDPDNLYLAGRDLSGRFAVTSRSHQAALVAGQHAPKDRHRRVAQVFDLARIANKSGCPVLRVLCEGRAAD